MKHSSMVKDSDSAHWTVLERLDVALASRISADATGESVASGELVRPLPDRDERSRFIAGALALRGVRVTYEDALRSLFGESGRFRPDHQEYKLLRGANDALEALWSWSIVGRAPDGWHLVELFRKLTDGIQRFRNNSLRRDRPWDALPHVDYPDADEIQERLDVFLAAEAYGESVEGFGTLHPVRRAFRMFWRFTRIAPFPDFNIPIGFLGLNAYLVAHGYPLLVAELGDRETLARVVRSHRPPSRITGFETRLLESVANGS